MLDVRHAKNTYMYVREGRTTHARRNRNEGSCHSTSRVASGLPCMIFFLQPVRGRRTKHWEEHASENFRCIPITVACVWRQLFERSEFLIAASQKKKLCVCSTNLGFSVGYVLCTRYVCTTLYDTRYVLCTRYIWYEVRIMYQIRMYHTCCCTINSTAVSLFVYSLVGGGTHDTYVPPKKQLYRYLFIR